MDVKNAVISRKNKLRFDKGFKIWLFQAFKERDDVAFYGSSVCVMQWTGVIRDGTVI